MIITVNVEMPGDQNNVADASHRTMFEHLMVGAYDIEIPNTVLPQDIESQAINACREQLSIEEHHLLVLSIQKRS